MYIMFLDVTHQHSDKNGFHRVVAQKISFAGLPPRTPPKWQLLGRQPTPDRNFSLQRPVMETFVGGAELLRRWGWCLEARVAAPPLLAFILIRPAAIMYHRAHHHQLRALYPGAAAK